MKPEIVVRKLSDGRVQAKRTDGKPLTDEDKIEAKKLLEGPDGDNPLVGRAEWYPEVQKFTAWVQKEYPDLDFRVVEETDPVAYQDMKKTERQIDALGTVRLQTVIRLLWEWRDQVAAMAGKEYKRAEQNTPDSTSV